MKVLVVLISTSLLPLLMADSVSTDITCKIIWIFKEPCMKPNQALVQQVKSWGSKKCPEEQEKCMYEILTTSRSHLEVMHTSRDLNRTTLMYFDFYPPESPKFCKIWAYSVTSPSSANNTNEFCLFHNLFQGSGLTNAPGYREITNEKMCSSVSSATCFQGDQLSTM